MATLSVGRSFGRLLALAVRSGVSSVQKRRVAPSAASEPASERQSASFVVRRSSVVVGVVRSFVRSFVVVSTERQRTERAPATDDRPTERKKRNSK